MNTEKATENQQSSAAVGGPRLSEGLGPTQPEREAQERAYNAGFVEASRLHGVEIEKLRREVAMLRATMEGAAHQLSKARIWDGMEWYYNPLHPVHYKPALDRLREVLDRA